MTISFESSWSWNRVTFNVSLYSKLLDTIHDYVWEGDEDDDT
jgi:hypothetical protein